MYRFEEPLLRGTMLKRKSQFTAVVDLNGEELIAHIPTTNRIGDVAAEAVFFDRPDGEACKRAGGFPV